MDVVLSDLFENKTKLQTWNNCRNDKGLSSINNIEECYQQFKVILQEIVQFENNNKEQLSFNDAEGAFENNAQHFMYKWTLFEGKSCLMDFGFDCNMKKSLSKYLNFSEYCFSAVQEFVFYVTCNNPIGIRDTMKLYDDVEDQCTCDILLFSLSYEQFKEICQHAKAQDQSIFYLKC